MWTRARGPAWLQPDGWWLLVPVWDGERSREEDAWYDPAVYAGSKSLKWHLPE